MNALNRLNATRTMERYLGYIINVAAGSDGHLQPVYRISGRAELEETVVASLPGYRGMGPVRVGNQAFRQVQNDVYGSAILAATHAFFDNRLAAVGNAGLFRRLEVLGERAVQLHASPDAGLWELRGSSHVHTFSSRHVLGGLRPARQDRRAGWASRSRRAAGAPRPTASTP